MLDRPRAIAVAVAKLRLTHAPAPIARRFTRQLLESGGEGGLRGIAELRGDRAVLSLKDRQKWKRDRPASDASAESETSASLSERRRSIARRRIVGERPPMVGCSVAATPA